MLYFFASDALAVIAINLSISPDQEIASRKFTRVSSVVNDLDETKKLYRLDLRLQFLN